MRPLRRTLCVLSFACALPAVAVADEFSEYRIPDHSGGSWFGNLGGNYQGNADTSPGQSRRSRFLSVGVSAGWDRFHDSDRWLWEVSADGGLGGHRATLHQENSALFGSGVDRGDVTFRTADENASIFAASRAYPWSFPLGWDVSGQVALSESQGWEERTLLSVQNSIVETRVEESSASEQWRYREEALAGLMLGVGRVRDATPVFTALLLEERLRRDGALVRALSRDARQRVAALYAMRFNFGIPHDQPEKFFWKELERVLREDGAVADSGFDAYSIRHADDALSVVQGTFRRSVGFFVGPTLTARHMHDLFHSGFNSRARHFTDGVNDGDVSFSGSSRQRSFRDITFYGLTAEYDRPLGERTQLLFFEAANIELRADPNLLEVRGSMRLQHLVAERWFLQTLAAHVRTLDPDAHESTWFAQAGGQVDYYLEDFARASFSLTQSWSRQPSGSGDGTKDTALQARFEITVGRGWFDAPGLLRPQRALN